MSTWPPHCLNVQVISQGRGLESTSVLSHSGAHGPRGSWRRRGRREFLADHGQAPGTSFVSRSRGRPRGSSCAGCGRRRPASRAGGWRRAGRPRDEAVQAGVIGADQLVHGLEEIRPAIRRSGRRGARSRRIIFWAVRRDRQVVGSIDSCVVRRTSTRAAGVVLRCRAAVGHGGGRSR